ncbi:hypothetical protein [Phascolarctobacterium sp.]|uniref:hypothetical protein n=1 Tax=Phascolarctobacterium sp. TaxID=2049039 RepID=UPI0026DB8E5A|nr:hypothetical protein [Phascolarctobacterium sp.]
MKNYLNDYPGDNNRHSNKSSVSEYVQAFLDFLRRPKTVFDLKDRLRLALLLIAVIILLQKVVELLCD